MTFFFNLDRIFLGYRLSKASGTFRAHDPIFSVQKIKIMGLIIFRGLVKIQPQTQVSIVEFREETPQNVHYST